MKVLVADDGATTRRLLEVHLEQWGYDVVSAADGNKAWALISRPDTPRLIILDWIMPGMDGIEVCRKARLLEHGKLLHIIIFTSLVIKDSLATALEAGADDFISKKFETEELQARLKVGERVVKLKSELAEKAGALAEARSHIERLRGILPV